MLGLQATVNSPLFGPNPLLFNPLLHFPLAKAKGGHRISEAVTSVLPSICTNLMATSETGRVRFATSFCSFWGHLLAEEDGQVRDFAHAFS